jgi:hypothetical protein
MLLTPFIARRKDSWRRRSTRSSRGRVFNRTINPDDVSEGYGAMGSREALKVIVQP